MNAAPLQTAEKDLLVPPYTLGAWLGDGTSAAAQITTADPEILLRIEAEGVVAHPSAVAKYRYQLRLPEAPPVAERECVVCGRLFVPLTSQVRTCGRSCGGRARFMSDPVADPTCSRCD
ncbi:MAG TPA: replicative DNA helicase, partial [Mycobacterium sp.]|nr:replicative DNA helicase [Mycobacterium sp.]